VLVKARTNALVRLIALFARHSKVMDGLLSLMRGVSLLNIPHVGIPYYRVSIHDGCALGVLYRDRAWSSG
jgi:hypothetical protein